MNIGQLTVGNALLAGMVASGAIILLLAHLALRRDMSPLTRAFSFAVTGVLAAAIVVVPLRSNGALDIMHTAAMWRHTLPVIGWTLTLALAIGITLPIPCGVGALAGVRDSVRGHVQRHDLRVLRQAATRRLERIRRDMTK